MWLLGKVGGFLVVHLLYFFRMKRKHTYIVLPFNFRKLSDHTACYVSAAVKGFLFRMLYFKLQPGSSKFKLLI